MSYVTPGARAGLTALTLTQTQVLDLNHQQPNLGSGFISEWSSSDDAWPVPESAPKKENIPLIRQAGPKPSVEIAYRRNYIPGLALAVHSSTEISYRARTGELLVLDAVQQGNRDAVRVLLGRGDSPDHADGQGRTLLMIAAERGDTAMIAALIPYGPDVNRQDNNGNTALMYACRQNNLDAISLLVRAGADKKLRNREGLNAAEVATAYGCKAAFQWLALFF